MPIYDIVAAAEALNISLKQLDNILSRNEMPGIERRSRGVTRRISPEAVVTLRLALELQEHLGLTTGAALRVARSVEEHNGSADVGEFATLHVALDGVRADTLRQLNAAVEAVGRRPRGRPPGVKVRPPQDA